MFGIYISFSSSLFYALLQVKKHIKQGQGHEGGIFSVEAPLHVSNVQVLDPVTGYRINIDFRFENLRCLRLFFCLCFSGSGFLLMQEAM